MKTITWILRLLLLVMVLVMLVGCGYYEVPYTFRQDLVNVTKVEICEFDPAPNDRDASKRKMILQLSKSDAQSITEEISTLKCIEKSVIGYVPQGYGRLAICLTYANGEIELIGMGVNGYITSNGKEYLTNYCNNARDIYDLILKYVDPELLPDLRSEYPEEWFS